MFYQTDWIKITKWRRRDVYENHEHTQLQGSSVEEGVEWEVGRENKSRKTPCFEACYGSTRLQAKKLAILQTYIC